jgi:hypothetical protein
MTVTSLPDDYVHYSKPRTFSVREWARMQTFPDKHQFSGPRTTGGHRRAGNPTLGNWSRDVPKYTQIGNAVPPLLGKAIGERVKEIIKGSSIEKNKITVGQPNFFESLSEEHKSSYNELSSKQKKAVRSFLNTEEFLNLLKQTVLECTQEDLQDPKKVSFMWKAIKKSTDVVISNAAFKLLIIIASGGLYVG